MIHIIILYIYFIKSQEENGHLRDEIQRKNLQRQRVMTKTQIKTKGRGGTIENYPCAHHTLLRRQIVAQGSLERWGLIFHEMVGL